MKAVLPSGDLSALLKIGSSPLKYDPIKDPDNSGYGRISLSGGKLFVESSSMTMSAKAVGDATGEDGHCCLQLDVIAEMLKVMPAGEDAVLETDDLKLKLKVGKSKCSFGCLHANTIAPLGSPSKDLPSLKLSLDELTSSISAASVSGEPNDADGIRSNVLLEVVDGTLMAVGTDNIRCSIVPIPGECTIDFRGTVSIKGSKALKTLECTEVSVAKLGESVVFLDGSGGFIQFQQSESALKGFPDFRPILTVPYIDELKMSTERFTTVMAGANKINPQECVMFVEDDEIAVANTRLEDGTEYRDSVTNDGQPGYDIKVALCPLLLIDYLKTLKSDSLSFFFSPDRNGMGSPGHIMIRDEAGSLFFVKSLVCLVEMPVL